MSFVIRSDILFPITADVYNSIKSYIGEFPAERGGMLGKDSEGLVTYFCPDPTAMCTAGAYDPDISSMNSVIQHWKQDNIIFCGFSHSHPPKIRNLSSHDKWYAGQILSVFTKLQALWLPIIMTLPDSGSFDIIPYAAVPGRKNRKNCDIIRTSLVIIDSTESI